MRRLVFDLETISKDFDSLDETSKAMLEMRFKRYATTPEEIEEEKSKLTFSPLTAEIVAIGMLDADTDRGACYFQAPGGHDDFESGGVKYEPGDERTILQKFWHAAAFYDEFITFAGRTFDAPMLLIRSAILGIRPSKNLMTNRYLESQPSGLRHIDLQDQLSFYGAKRDPLGLHFWTSAFDIPSPKTGAITGDDITRVFRNGAYREIAEYCMGDVTATRALFRKWETYLRL